MDPRRPPRTVIDPKVRQVGFITPGDPPSRAVSDLVGDSAAQPSPDFPAGNSISPVMIIPPRHASDGLTRSSAVAVPGAPMSPLRRDSLPIGSYNPSESLLGTSPTATATTMSPTSQIDGGSEFSEEVPALAWLGRSGSGKYAASSLPVSSGEMMALKVGGHGEMTGLKLGGQGAAVSSLTTASVVKVLPGVSEIGGTFLETHTEVVGISSTMKQKMTRADRRAIQEAQRAAKAAAKDSGEGVKASAASGGVPANQKQVKAAKPPQKKDGPPVTVAAAASEKKAVDRLPEKDRKKDVPPPRMQFDDKHRVDKAKRRALVNQSEPRNRVELFRHLPQYVHGTQLPDLESKFFQLDPMHPSVYKVGLQYLSGDISGGNARCIAMLLAFQDAIKDYTTPPEKNLVRDLAAKISSYVSFLIECRPLSISMGNAIKFLKDRIAKLQQLSLSESEAKTSLQSDIDRFINEKIILADKVIVGHAVTKIRDGDVLLVYGSSCVVEMILLYAHELGKQFRVVVVDSRPKLEGQVLLRRLVAKGIVCTICPARSHIEQSRNTLLFASCAKEVVTSARINVVMSDKALVKHLQKELARLESEL